jgi:hypothetical protein
MCKSYFLFGRGLLACAFLLPTLARAEWWQSPAAHMTQVVPVVVAPPTPHFDPRTYGAKGDGVTYDTAALQKAIDACGGTGGSVILGPGQYVSAQLTLHGRMTFYLQKGAVLLGGTNPADYPVLIPDGTPAKANCRGLIYAANADGLIIDGDGEINGQCKLLNMKGDESQRPSLLRIFQSNGVTVRNITLTHPRMWTEVYSECGNLTVDHITVDAPPDAINLDGIDICDSHDVTVRNCDITSEDDAVCLKSHGAQGLQNILVENNRIRSTKADGIKIGTATVGPISHIVFRNNTVLGASIGGLCIEDVDGGLLSDVEVFGLDMYRVSQPVFIRLGKRVGNKAAGDLTPADRPIGSINNVVIQNVRSIGNERARRPSNTITGINNGVVKGVTIKDCYFEMPGGDSKVPGEPRENDGAYPQSSMFGDTPAYGFYLRHAKGIVFNNVTVGILKPDARPWIVIAGDAEATTDGCKQLNVVPPTPVP